MRAFLVPIAAAVVLCLAGCAQVAPPGSSPAPSQTPSEDTSPGWLSEEPVTLTVGRAVDLSRTRGLPKAIVSVEAVTEQATCPSGAIEPSQGQFIAIQLTAHRVGESGQFDLAVYDWLTVDVAGQEHDGQMAVVSGLCLEPADGVSLEYDAGGRAAGSIMIDAPLDVSLIRARNPLAQPPVTISVELPPR
ncbi:MAG: hypothetical protein LBJ44_11530 [Propionibacteriaceae bacterium]|jgi:hypothetical protein|nr:hypothetical protein [Propionibacteriaceae bacterium]